MLTKSTVEKKMQKTIDMRFVICDSHTHTETTDKQKTKL